MRVETVLFVLNILYKFLLFDVCGEQSTLVPFGKKKHTWQLRQISGTYNLKPYMATVTITPAALFHIQISCESL